MTARRVSAGFTAVEVMMALAMLAIGAAAVFSMQRIAIQSTADARKADMANNIARSWLERLRRDATQATAGNWGNAALFVAANIDSAQNGGWFIPSAYVAQSGGAYAFDILGRDLAAANAGAAQFCVHTRLTTLVPSQLVRAEVRVVWLRGTVAPASGGFCQDSQVSTITGNTAGYKQVQVASAIRINPVTGL